MAAPLIVSSARIQIIAMNFMAAASVPIVAKNVRPRCNFATIPGKIMANFKIPPPKRPEMRAGRLLRGLHAGLSLA